MSSDYSLSCDDMSPPPCSPDKGPVANLGAAGQHKLEPAVVEAVEVQLLIRVLGVRVAGGVVIPDNKYCHIYGLTKKLLVLFMFPVS